MNMKAAATWKSHDILRALTNPSQFCDSPWSFGDLRALLEHQLGSLLVTEIDRFVEVSHLSPDRARSIINASGCRTFWDLINAGPSARDAMRLLKEWAKASMKEPGDYPRDVARVFYVLAILRGRQVGFDRISALDGASLEREARRCLTFGWLPDDVRTVLGGFLKNGPNG